MIIVTCGRRRALALIAAALIAVCQGGCTSDPLSETVLVGHGESNKAARVATLIRVGAATAKSGDLAGAATLYRRAHSLDPKNIEALIRLGRVLSALGASNDAAETFRKALGLDRNNLDAIFGLANTLVELKEAAAAIKMFETALGRREEPRTYNALSVAHDMIGDHSVAQAYYRAGLTLAPGNLNLRNNLGLSLALVGQYDEAVRVLRQVAADPRAGRRQRLNLALAYGLAGDSEAAAEIARIDLDEESVRRNLTYYRTLRALRDTKATAGAIGVHKAFESGQ